VTARTVVLWWTALLLADVWLLMLVWRTLTEAIGG
jgi:hypothetical protein